MWDRIAAKAKKTCPVAIVLVESRPKRSSCTCANWQYKQAFSSDGLIIAYGNHNGSMILWQEKVVHAQQHLPPCSIYLHTLHIYVWNFMDTAIITPFERSHYRCAKMSMHLLGCRGTKRESLAVQSKNKKKEQKKHRHPHMGCRQTHTPTASQYTRSCRHRQWPFFSLFYSCPRVWYLCGEKKKKKNIYKLPVKKSMVARKFAQLFLFSKESVLRRW